jgi:O-antigen/teichoic acid export membrane protein
MIWRVADFGISDATRKYMAEYLGRREFGIVRAVFQWALVRQAVVALAVTTGALLALRAFGDPSLRTMSALLVLSLLPWLLNNPAAEANNAAERVGANVPASVAGSLGYLAMVVLTLALDWGVVGLAAGVLLKRMLELAVRLPPVFARIRRLSSAELPATLHRRMLAFSGYGLVQLVVSLVVWERSELVFLKHFSSGIREVTFYTIASSISNWIVLVPVVFAQAVNTTLLAQFGRDRGRLSPLVSGAARYLVVTAMPLLLGTAALSRPVVGLLYGPEYAGAASALTLAAILALPKSFLLPARGLLQASENQRFLTRWLLAVGAFNLCLDWLLIPAYGATGAVVANGVAQSVAVFGMWAKARRVLRLDLPWGFLLRVTASALPMVALAIVSALRLPPLAATCVAVPGGAFVFVTMLRCTGALGTEDRLRLGTLGSRFPARVQPWFGRALDVLIPTREGRPA